MKKLIFKILTICLIFGAMFMSVQAVYANSEPEGCIAFTSSEPFEVSLGYEGDDKTWDGKVQFSTDGSNWYEYLIKGFVETEEPQNGEYSVFFRGKDNSHICTKSNGTCFQLTEGEISCSGNIENLLDYTEVQENRHPVMSDYAFKGLFTNCTSLTEAPELPATTLADHCYASMFYNCERLTEAPELPATTLAEACYGSMFWSCISLTEAPELPVTTLAAYCYSNMFNNCTKLTEAPELPATTLAEYCYYQMFLRCTSLTEAPELPATTLADDCYNKMFYNSGVKLSEEKGIFDDDSDGNLDGVFYGIPYRVPKEGTGTAGSYSLSDMFSNTSGRFTGPMDVNTTYYLSCWDGSGTEKDPFIISTKDDWDVLADLVSEEFAMENLCFRLENNITVDRMVGANGKPFSGSFDGGEKTLTFNADPAPEICAPFAYTKNASFKDLHVAGTIKTDQRFAAGLIGQSGGKATITNCRSSIIIVSSKEGDGTHGGFVAKGGADFEGCVFDGKLLGPKTTLCGGFLGWADPEGACSFKNCLFAAQELTLSGGLEPFCRHVTAATPIENCYFTKNIDRVQGKAARAVTADEGITVGSADMTVYSVSGITAYDTGLAYGNTFYAGKDDVIPVTIPYACDKLSASAGTVTGEGTSHTLTMPDGTVHLTLAKGANHKWKFTGFTWTGDEDNGYTAAIANYECENDPAHKDTVKKVSLDQKVTKPNCTTGGKTAFTAAVTATDSLDGKEHSESKDGVATNALGHKWKFTGFTWTGDEDNGYTAAVANYECENDPSHKDTVTKVALDQKVTKPTCLAGGKTTFTTAVTATDSLDGKEHSESKDAVATSAAGHKWKAATCTEPKTCEICHVTEGEAAGHAWGAWTALDEKQHQRVCGNDTAHVETKDHVWDEGAVTKEPTTEETGEKTFTCEVCKATSIEILPKLDIDPITPSDDTADDTPVDDDIPVVNTAKIHTKGNFTKKQMKLIFPADESVTNYRIQYRMAGKKTWKSGLSAGTNMYVIGGVKKSSLCEFRIAGYVEMEDGTWVRGNWSKISYRYMSAVPLKTIKADKKKITVTWTKDKKASGYEVRYSLKKNMKKAKTIYVKVGSKTKLTIKKLKSGKKYYVQIRPAKVKSGKKYVGILTNVKIAKVK